MSGYFHAPAALTSGKNPGPRQIGFWLGNRSGLGVLKKTSLCADDVFPVRYGLTYEEK